MFEPLILRDDTVIPGLVVVRLGARTLERDHLQRSVEESHQRWGIWGFSVLEVPHGDYNELARMRPVVADRRQILIADGTELVDSGFPLLPTLEWPHWTVTLAAATDTQFDRVGSHFRGPFDNPAFARRR